jgi:hypothetical protein
MAGLLIFETALRVAPDKIRDGYRPCDQAAAAGVNLATMPSIGLKVCLARSV